jgi:phosphoserine phosphatase
VNLENWPYHLVTFDLDGTLTNGHGWESIARAAGRLDEFRAINRRFLARETGEDEHLRDLLEIASGMEIGRFHELLAARSHVVGIPETIAALHERGAMAAVLTHNPKVVCDWYVDAFGFDDAEGTDGVRVVEGRIEVPGPIRADKSAGLAKLLSRHEVSAGSTCHVGDGWADARIFPQVGAGIAFNSRHPDVDRAADVALHDEELTAVVRALDRLPPRPM